MHFRDRDSSLRRSLAQACTPRIRKSAACRNPVSRSCARARRRAGPRGPWTGERWMSRSRLRPVRPNRFQCKLGRFRSPSNGHRHEREREREVGREHMHPDPTHTHFLCTEAKKRGVMLPTPIESRIHKRRLSMNKRYIYTRMIQHGVEPVTANRPDENLHAPTSHVSPEGRRQRDGAPMEAHRRSTDGGSLPSLACTRCGKRCRQRDGAPLEAHGRSTDGGSLLSSAVTDVEKEGKEKETVGRIGLSWLRPSPTSPDLTKLVYPYDTKMGNPFFFGPPPLL
jgi:hypothetical protein